MGRIERQKRKLIEESNKRLLGEAYSGIINRGDDICEIICKRKIAKSGSNGDVVKYIQHLLAHNDFNVEHGGGGMGKECADLYEGCDGKFKRHTKDAVEEFQRRYKLSVDGVVGYNTWESMCDNLEFTESLPKKEFCKDCQCNEQDQPIGGDEKDTPSPTDDYIVDELEIIDCKDLKYCVGKHLYQTAPDIVAFYRCVSEKVGLPDTPNPKKDCGDCPEWVNEMPRIRYDDQEMEPRSKFIQDCMDRGCTKRAV